MYKVIIILIVVLCGCIMWSLTRGKNINCKHLETKCSYLLGSINVGDQFSILHNEELCDLNSSHSADIALKFCMDFNN
jgi:hypothetical protein